MPEKGNITMKKLRLLRALCIVPVLALLLVSLGGFVKVDTRMDINSDFRGTREITVSFHPDDAEAALKDGVEQFESILSSNIPASMTYETTSSYSPTEYIVILKFNSLDDYKKKVESIIGRTPDIKWGHSALTGQTYLHEDFSSLDLLGWLSDALAKAGIPEADPEYVPAPVQAAPASASDAASSSDSIVVISETPKAFWTVSNPVLVVDGVRYQSSSDKMISGDSSSCVLKAVEVTTVIDSNENFTRTISFELAADANEQLLESINDYLKLHKPADSQFISDANTERNLCTIEFKAEGTEQLAEYTSNLLDCSAKVALGDYSDPTSNSLVSSTAYKESFDLLSLNSAEPVPVTYRFISDNGVPSKLYDLSGGFAQAVEAPVDGNTISYTTDSGVISLQLILDSIVSAQSVDYNLIVEKPDSFTREIMINMPVGTSADVLEEIAKFYRDTVYLSPVLSGTDIARSAFDVDVINSNSKLPAVAITLHGTGEEISTMEDILFGTSEQKRSLSYTRKKNLLVVRPESEVIDCYDISTLLSMTGTSLYTYAIKTNDKFTSVTYGLGDYSKTTDVTEQKANIICQTLSDGSQVLTFKGRYTNLSAIIFIALLGLLLLVLLALAITTWLSTREDEEEEEPKAIEAEEPARLEAPEPVYEPVYEPEPIPEPEPEPEPAPIRDLISIIEDEPEEIKQFPDSVAPVIEPEPIPEPEPEPVPEPEPQPTPFDDYVDRFPMEDLPEIVPSPIETIDTYGQKDFIEDLRSLGYLDEFRHRFGRSVKVKVRRRTK